VPDLWKIVAMISNILNTILLPFKDITRLLRKFRMEEKKFSFLLWFRRDIELLEFQQSLNTGNAHEAISRCFHYYSNISAILLHSIINIREINNALACVTD